MENDIKDKLKKMLDSGEINQAVYDEIMKRWNEKDQYEDTEKRTKQENAHSAYSSDSVIVISGSGELPEAKAHELKISGSGRINGPVEVDSMSASGSAHIEGDITAKERIRISGSLRTSAKIKSGTLEISGGLRSGSISCKIFENSGSAKINGDIIADSLETSGSFRANNVECKEMESSGSINAEKIEGKKIMISGAVNADYIKAEEFELENFGGRTSIGLIESKSVKVDARNNFLFNKSQAEIDEIKADTVEIENVRSKKILAEEAIIGDYCEIDYLEARTIKLSNKAKVREKKIVGEE